MWATEQGRQNGEVKRTLKEAQNPEFQLPGCVTMRKITSSLWVLVSHL